MRVEPLALDGMCLLRPDVAADERGFFMETFRDGTFRREVADHAFVQENHSFSEPHVLRGLHYQWQHPQGKLIRVIGGSVFNVAVDLRASSPTFGQWSGVRIDDRNKAMLWVPPGMAQGFYVEDTAVHYLYKCTDYYAPGDEYVIHWADAELDIDWPVPAGSRPIVSEKDQGGLRYRDAPRFD